LVDHRPEPLAPGLTWGGAQYVDTVIADATGGLLSDSLAGTLVHELGHVFGLCDEGYGKNTGCEEATFSYCPNPPAKNSLMCSADMCETGCSQGENFSAASYKHLKKAFICNSLIPDKKEPDTKELDCWRDWEKYVHIGRLD
jgi:hypothetical protein